LFVGFLWRRWGSDPGGGKFSSGFEEEFSRAIERREKTGSPEICLFFKEAGVTTLSELDDQLKRVLGFREVVACQPASPLGTAGRKPVVWPTWNNVYRKPQ
jgi:hypothetical protein